MISVRLNRKRQTLSGKSLGPALPQRALLQKLLETASPSASKPVNPVNDTIRLIASIV
jgi:hypothetical protein